MKNTTLPACFRLVIGVASLFACQQAGAAVLVGYNFGPPSTTNPTSTLANVTGSTFDFGPGLSGGTGISTVAGSPSQPSPFVRSSVTTEAVGSGSTDYLTFTITPDAGYEVSFTSLAFAYSYEEQAGVTGKTATFTLRSSLDGYASDIGTPLSRTATSTGAVWITGNSISLSSLPASSSAVTFRLYLTDDSTLFSDIIRADNFLLNGSIAAVPEPSAFALLGAGLGSLWVLRRRRA